MNIHTMYSCFQTYNRFYVGIDLQARVVVPTSSTSQIVMHLLIVFKQKKKLLCVCFAWVYATDHHAREMSGLIPC